MSRIEDLPDDFDESIDLNKQGLPTADTDDATMDDIYDRAVARGGLTDKTFEEAMSDLSKHPIFMTSLDQANEDSGENEMLEALKALQHEGTKSEVAQNFKEQGNEAVQEKRWKDAKEFYSKGLAVLLSKEDIWDNPDNVEDEEKLKLTLTEQLHSNRARCNLELKNYRSTTLDCAAVLQLNPQNVKAHYRSASALFALDKVYEALDVCYRGLKLDSSNQAMQTLLTKIQKRSRVKEEQDRKRKTERDRLLKEKQMLATALKARNIKLRASGKPPDMADATIRLSPDPLSPTSQLKFPVMFLYPMHNQSDFIKAFDETDSIADHLTYLLPTPWDGTDEYKEATVDCYMDTTTGGLLKVGKKISLLEVLSNDKVEVLDGLVRIYMVPRSLAPRWIEEIKKKGK